MRVAIRVTTFDPDFFVSRPCSGPAAKFDIIASHPGISFLTQTRGRVVPRKNRPQEMKSVVGSCRTITAFALSNLCCAYTFSLRE